VEPAEGKVNLEAIARYHAIFKAIQKAGIEPVATLHHFVHPKWFEDKGGFTDEGNLPLFVNFCEIAVREFGQYVTQWVTFNEPAVLCTTGYWFGLFPPGAVSGICFFAIPFGVRLCCSFLILTCNILQEYYVSF
jgi:beta-glucosidase